MILSLTAEMTCPECDYPFEFEVFESSGKMDVTCPACKNVQEVEFEVIVEIL